MSPQETHTLLSSVALFHRPWTIIETDRFSYLTLNWLTADRHFNMNMDFQNQKKKYGQIKSSSCQRLYKGTIWQQNNGNIHHNSFLVSKVFPQNTQLNPRKHPDDLSSGRRLADRLLINNYREAFTFLFSVARQSNPAVTCATACIHKASTKPPRELSWPNATLFCYSDSN